MRDDAELLRRYAGEKSEAAFAELVRRHVNFVYSAALRRVGGDAHLAEDVTQQVFTALARSAATLAEHPVLSGWLYTTTRNAAAQVVRTERRRQTREQESHAMNELTSSPARDAEWERLRPVLDGAMDELAEADRQAVLLRFFEGKSFADVAAKLQLTENTARMRVERALDKLHALLGRRGVTSTTAALSLALAGQATVAAPAGLAASITGVALAGTAATSAGWLTTIMGMTKLQIGITGALAIAGASVYFVQAETNAGLRREIAALRGQQQDVAALRVENRQLAATASEVEMLRRDDLELQQLVRRGEEAKKAMEERVRLMQSQNQQQSVQAEIDRMNRELKALFDQYTAMQAATPVSAAAEAEREVTRQKKIRDILAKNAEIAAFKASNGLAPTKAEAELEVAKRKETMAEIRVKAAEIKAFKASKAPTAEESANTPRP